MREHADLELHPDLVQMNIELGDIVIGTMASRRFNHNDPLKPIIAFLLGKAYKTQQAIVILCRFGYGQDAGLLVRSQLNLVIDAQWLNQDAANRVPAYIEYDWVLKARMGRNVINNPALLGANNMESLAEIKRNQPDLEEEERRVKETYNSDNRSWSGKSIREMARDVGLEGAYASAYVLLSNLEHSNSISANDYVIEGPEGYEIDVEPGPPYVKESLLTTHHLLLIIAKLANEVLELEIEAKLHDAEKREQDASGIS